MWLGGERDVENDYAVSFDLQKEFNNPNLILAPLFLSPVDAKDYILNFRLICSDNASCKANYL